MEAALLAARRAGRSLRDVAVVLYGREQVEADWHAGDWMRARLRRLLGRAGARAGARPDGVGPGPM